MTNLHSFVADYVRRTIASEGRRKAMLEVLSKGEPFCVEENMIVAMVDIAGYSSLASTLEGLMGKLSSEVITQTVGSYLGKIAEVVFQYHGDIVKFLGDAILVSFSAVDQNEDQQSVRRRAVSCCLEVLVKYPTQKIQLESWTQMLRATTKVERGTRDYDSGAVTRAEEGHQKSYSLSLHVALAEGPGSHVIIGVPSERLDYLVYSDSLRNLGKMLDGTKSGEMGIPVDLALSLELEVFASRADNGFFVLNGDPLKMAWDTIKESGAVLKPILKRTAISRSNLDISRSMTKTNNDEIKLLKNFVNKSILWRLDEQVEPAQEISDSSSQARRSSLRIRMPEKVLNGGVIRTEYRTISILFIKINDTFDSMIAQKLFTFLLDKLKTFDGVFQQYSVDDKGQSMLACFGLPPFIHEKCALFAVKAGASFMADLTKEHLKSITVGITTGDILFGTVGTENRRDTALLGDMINVAARLLSLKKEGTIVMDEYTKNLVETAFPVDDLGLVNLKGKAAPVRVWNISSFTPLIRRKTIYRDFLIQNKLERGRLENGVASWMNSRPEKCIFLIEGESGMGKSNLLSFLQRILRTSTVEPCIAHGSEVEQYNPYFAVREVITQMIRMSPKTVSQSSESLASSLTLGRGSVFGGAESPFNVNEVKRILIECKENPAYAAPLCSIVSGSSSSGRETFMKGMDAEGRKTILKSVIARMLAYLSQTKKMAILLDDVQWIDATSMEIFYLLADEYPSTFIGLFSRPIKPLEATNFLHKFAASSVVDHMVLTGLSCEDLGTMMVTSFGGKSIDQSMLNEIYNQTRGNLLQTDAIIRYLMDHSSDYIEINDEGYIRNINPEVLSQFLTKSVETVIMAQFDRLTSDFQHILRYASVLGQYFSIAELQMLLNDGNLSVDDIKALITKCDKFEFLKVFRDFNKSEAGSGFTGEVFFRHISIMNTVYGSIAYSERETLHLQMACHYESIADSFPAKRTQILPTICYHYLRTGKSAKILERNAELGFELASSCLYPEAQKALVRVKEYIDENRLGLETTLEAHEKYLLEPHFQCKLYSYLALICTMLRQFKDGKELAVSSLLLAGYTWPSSPKLVKKGTTQALKRFVRSWLKSSKGRKDIEVTKRDFRHLQLPWFNLVKISLNCLLLGLIYGAVDPALAPLTLLWNLSHALVTCSSDPNQWFKVTVLTAYALAQRGTSSTLLLSKKAMMESAKIKARCDDNVRAYFHLFGGLLPVFFLRVDEAIIVSKSFEQYWMERRVKSEYIKYFVAGTIHPQLRGVFNSTLTKVTDEWVVEMRKLDVVYLAVVVGILQQESFYLADLTSFEKYRKIELEYAAKIPDAMVMRLGNLRRNNVMLHTMLTSKSGLAVLNAARDTLENLMQYSVSFHHHGTFVYCFLTCIAFTSVDLLAPSIPAESVKLAVVTIESMIAKLKLIKHHSYFGKFGTMLMDVARFHLIKAKAKSIRPIKRIMNLKDVKPKIQPGGELGLIGAMCCALIGLSSHDDNTRRLNSRRAQSMFSEMGSPTLEKWAVGELRYQ